MVQSITSTSKVNSTHPNSSISKKNNDQSQLFYTTIDTNKMNNSEQGIIKELDILRGNKHISIIKIIHSDEFDYFKNVLMHDESTKDNPIYKQPIIELIKFLKVRTDVKLKGTFYCRIDPKYFFENPEQFNHIITLSQLTNFEPEQIQFIAIIEFFKCNNKLASLEWFKGDGENESGAINFPISHEQSYSTLNTFFSKFETRNALYRFNGKLNFVAIYNKDDNLELSQFQSSKNTNINNTSNYHLLNSTLTLNYKEQINFVVSEIDPETKKPNYTKL